MEPHTNDHSHDPANDTDAKMVRNAVGANADATPKATETLPDALGQLTTLGYHERFTLGDAGWIISADDHLWNPKRFRVDDVFAARPEVSDASTHTASGSQAPVVIAGTAVRSTNGTPHIRRGALVLNDLAEANDDQVEAVSVLLDREPAN